MGGIGPNFRSAYTSGLTMQMDWHLDERIYWGFVGPKISVWHQNAQRMAPASWRDARLR